ncbi:MAG: response regulator transcription factor [Acidiphilium sp.]|nr:response regulator transcription factor [Acidiphilium sp.]MDD4935674.1 response regulator transcription factor [Acidiphilium sp.]
MNLLVVDDHAIVRAGFARLFLALPNARVRYAANGREALKLMREDRPDVVLLDLNMPDISGFNLLQRIHAESKPARILVVTMYSDLHYVDRALASGAAGYMTKNAPPDELLTAVRAVHRGERYIEAAISQSLVLRHVDQGEPGAPLSSRDTDIVRLLAEGRSLGDIADQMGVSYKTIANNCSRIKAKLGLASTKDLLRYAIETTARM